MTGARRGLEPRPRAFTLVELVVVIVIVAVLATVAFVAYNSSVSQFESNAAEQSAAQVSKLYQADSAANQAPVAEQYVYDDDLASLPFAEDLPSDVTGVEVWDDGTMYVYMGDRECMGPAFSTVSPGASPVGEWDCSYVNTPPPPSDLTVSYSSLTGTAANAGRFVRGSDGMLVSPTVDGGSGDPLTFSYSGTLPTGVSFDTQTGVFTGPAAGDWPSVGPAAYNNGYGAEGAIVAPSPDGGSVVAMNAYTPAFFSGYPVPDTETPSYRVVIAHATPSGVFDWTAAAVPPALPFASAEVTGMAPAPDGTIFVSGRFNVEVDFGPYTLTDSTPDQGAGFVAALTPEGVWKWAEQVPDYYSPAFTVASDGSVIVAGGFHAAAEFGSDTLTPSSGQDGYIAKFNSDGVLLWYDQMEDDSAFSGSFTNMALAPTPSGGAYAAFNIRGSVTLGGDTVSAPAYYDTVVARIGGSGSWQWVSPAGASVFSYPTQLLPLPSGDVAVVGAISADAAFGTHPVSITATPNPAGYYSPFVASISPGGVWQWASAGDVTAGTPGFSYGMSSTRAVVTSDGGVVFGGQFSGQMTLAGETFTRLGGNNSTRVFAKVDSDGDWVYAVSSDSWEYPNAMAPLSSGGVAFGGSSDPDVTGVVALDGSGAVSWEAPASTHDYAGTRTVVSGPAGRLLVLGAFYNGVGGIPVGAAQVIAPLSTSGEWLGAVSGFSAPVTVTVTVSDGVVADGSVDVVLYPFGVYE